MGRPRLERGTNGLKVRDTLAGLVAAQVNANEQIERDFAKEALKKKRIRVVLHLEQPIHTSRLFPRAINPADVKPIAKNVPRYKIKLLNGLIFDPTRVEYPHNN